MILVKPFKGDNVSLGGIVVPDSCVKDSNKVLVVKTSKGTTDKPMRLKKGDIGYRVKEWGVPISIMGENYFLTEQDAIIALND